MIKIHEAKLELYVLTDYEAQLEAFVLADNDENSGIKYINISVYNSVQRSAPEAQLEAHSP